MSPSKKAGMDWIKKNFDLGKLTLESVMQILEIFEAGYQAGRRAQLVRDVSEIYPNLGK